MYCDCCEKCSHPYKDCVAESFEDYFGPCTNCHKKPHMVMKPVKLETAPCNAQKLVRHVAGDHRSDYHVCMGGHRHGIMHHCAQCDVEWMGA